MTATDWLFITSTGWLLIAWGAAGSIATGMLLAYWTRPWWYPKLIARRAVRRSRL